MNFENFGEKMFTPSEEEKRQEAAKEKESQEEKEQEGSTYLEDLEQINPDELTLESAEKINNLAENPEKLDDPELKEKAREAGGALDSEMEQKLEEKEEGTGFIENLKKNKTFKAGIRVFIAFMILFKGYSATAANEKVDIKYFQKIEASEQSEDSQEDENTYDATERFTGEEGKDDEKEKDKEGEKEGEREMEAEIEKDKSVLSLEQYFGHNSFEVKEGKKEEIINEVINFFEDMVDEDGEVNSEKLQNFLKTDAKIEASANELIRNQEGGNEALAENRAEALKKTIVENSDNIGDKLTEMDFDKKITGLILNKLMGAEVDIPEPDDGGEKDLSYLKHLKNSRTGEKFTEQEIENMKNQEGVTYVTDKISKEAADNMSQEEYENWLEKLRFARINVEVESEASEEDRINPPELEEMGFYDKITILHDVSASTGDDRQRMYERIQDKYQEIEQKYQEIEDKYGVDLSESKYSLGAPGKIELAPFIYELKDNPKEYTDVNEAFEKLQEEVPERTASEERALQTAAEYLDFLDNKNENKNEDEDEKTLVYVVTDEMLQDVVPEQVKDLQEKASEKNADFRFLVKAESAIDADGKEVDFKDEGKFVELNLDEIHKSAERCGEKWWGKDYPKTSRDILEVVTEDGSTITKFPNSSKLDKEIVGSKFLGYK